MKYLSIQYNVKNANKIEIEYFFYTEAVKLIQTEQ